MRVCVYIELNVIDKIIIFILKHFLRTQVQYGAKCGLRRARRTLVKINNDTSCLYISNPPVRTDAKSLIANIFSRLDRKWYFSVSRRAIFSFFFSIYLFLCLFLLWRSLEIYIYIYIWETDSTFRFSVQGTRMYDQFPNETMLNYICYLYLDTRHCLWLERNRWQMSFSHAENAALYLI